MGMLTNEMLFYGGMVIIGCAVVGLIVSMCVLKMKKYHLNTQLNKEYGEK